MNKFRNEDYKCSKCNEFSVALDRDFQVWETDRGEEGCTTYTCLICQETAYIRDRYPEDNFAIGDTIFF